MILKGTRFASLNIEQSKDIIIKHLHYIKFRESESSIHVARRKEKPLLSEHKKRALAKHFLDFIGMIKLDFIVHQYV